ncbi:MAG: TonB-dependent receptor plug domain-containing protein [Hyphomicrobiaceae bacterium]|nr:TonB-dependent receptor plug domain-containing protein [Hyphomicrobiaceae bacterium]
MLRKTMTLRAIAVTAGLMGSAEFVNAQQAEADTAPPSSSAATNLPPLEVTSKKAKKKVTKAKPAPKAPPPAAVTQAPVDVEPANVAPAFPATGVSGPSTPGTQQINVTSQDLARNNPTDISDVFKGEPGVQVGSSLPASQKVYVHGIEETNLAVTIDGALQNNKVFHHNGTNFIDPNLLKAVRVDAGVAPADAGFGALAGSIAYETKDVGDFLTRDGIGGFNKATFNTNGNVFTNAVTGYGMHNGFEVLGTFNFGEGGNFEDRDGDEVGGTSTSLLSGLGKIAYQAPRGDRFEVSHERFNDEALRPFRANASVIVTPRPRPWEPRFRDYELNRQSTVFSYSDATPTALWDPKIVLAYGKTDVTTPIFLRTETYDATGETDRINGKIENTFRLGIGSLVAGFDFNRSQASLADRYDPGEEESAVAGAYAQARLEPVRGTRVSFGGRGDHQRFEGVNGQSWSDGGFSGNVSGEQDLYGDLLTAKAGYSHVWAGVPLAENFIINPGWNYLDGPESVTADNVTAGLRSRFGGFTIEGTLFRTEIDDARVAAYGALLATRARDIESEGYEIGAGYDWSSGFIRAKYAHIDVTIDGLAADSDTGNYVATPVGDIITITAAHRFERIGLTVGGDIEIATEYDRVAPSAVTGENSPPYPAYEIVNLFAEYHPQDWTHDLTFRLDVRNLFDQLYSSRATYGNEFGNVTPLYEPGRAFLLSTKASF